MERGEQGQRRETGFLWIRQAGIRLREKSLENSAKQGSGNRE
jgi:hypothetical protein